MPCTPTDVDAAAVAAIAVVHTFLRAARAESKLSRLYACHELQLAVQKIH